MALVSDILATYAGPRAVMRRHLVLGQREDRVLIYLMLACALIFVAQWPRLARQAYIDDAVPLDALLGGALMGWLFIAPLALYALAGLSHLVARMIGGQGTWYAARLALFWSLLASSPLWLLNGLVAGFIGNGPALTLTGLIALASFLIIFSLSLVEAERPQVPA
jgi:hypothetical protein